MYTTPSAEYCTVRFPADHAGVRPPPLRDNNPGYIHLTAKVELYQFPSSMNVLGLSPCCEPDVDRIQHRSCVTRPDGVVAVNGRPWDGRIPPRFLRYVVNHLTRLRSPRCGRCPAPKAPACRPPCRQRDRLEHVVVGESRIVISLQLTILNRLSVFGLAAGIGRERKQSIRRGGVD